MEGEEQNVFAEGGGALNGGGEERVISIGEGAVPARQYVHEHLVLIISQARIIII